MKHEQPKPGKAGETSQWPKWEGPDENRPSGYVQGESDIFEEENRSDGSKPQSPFDATPQPPLK